VKRIHIQKNEYQAKCEQLEKVVTEKNLLSKKLKTVEQTLEQKEVILRQVAHSSPDLKVEENMMERVENLLKSHMSRLSDSICSSDAETTKDVVGSLQNKIERQFQQFHKERDQVLNQQDSLITTLQKNEHELKTQNASLSEQLIQRTNELLLAARRNQLMKIKLVTALEETERARQLYNPMQMENAILEKRLEKKIEENVQLQKNIERIEGELFTLRRLTFQQQIENPEDRPGTDEKTAASALSLKAPKEEEQIFMCKECIGLKSRLSTLEQLRDTLQIQLFNTQKDLMRERSIHETDVANLQVQLNKQQHNNETSAVQKAQIEKLQIQLNMSLHQISELNQKLNGSIPKAELMEIKKKIKAKSEKKLFTAFAEIATLEEQLRKALQKDSDSQQQKPQTNEQKAHTMSEFLKSLRYLCGTFGDISNNEKLKLLSDVLSRKLKVKPFYDESM
jgi:hypothetical protein